MGKVTAQMSLSTRGSSTPNRVDGRARIELDDRGSGDGTNTQDEITDQEITTYQEVTR